jgi:beta-ureidopropionase / N-carbamoyl-L-amino-acid hydrolase
MTLQPERAVSDLRELRELTEDERGAQRVAWTDTWAEAREWLRGKLAEVPGIDVEQDAAGNVWATLRGESERELLLGGHIDSVPDGGWLDGSLGLLGGLEVLRRLAGEGSPPVTVSLVDWADEEGRFGRSLLGSSMAAGAATHDELAALRDRDGVALPEALAEHGVDLRAATASADGRLASAAAYLELHIEQGPVLERERLPLAVVTGTAGVERHAVRFEGRSVQGGGFPMTPRQDALVAASRLVLDVRGIPGDESGRATVGDVTVRPGIPTAVPGEAELVLDERHPDAAALADMLGRTVDASERIAAEEGVSVSWREVWRIDPAPFDDRLIELAEAAIAEVAEPGPRLFSGALHDAAELARAGVPTVMLFVQSLGGASHNREEDTLPEHLELAVAGLDRLAAKTIDLVSSR